MFEKSPHVLCIDRVVVDIKAKSSQERSFLSICLIGMTVVLPLCKCLSSFSPMQSYVLALLF